VAQEVRGGNNQGSEPRNQKRASEVAGHGPASEE
jgi:hypothetical protein